MLTYNCSRGEETQTTKLNLLQNQYKSRGCGQREGIKAKKRRKIGNGKRWERWKSGEQQADEREREEREKGTCRKEA